MATRLRSFAKINLGLGIGPVRGDGYHGLLTVYQTVGIHDVVTVEARRAVGTRISIAADSPRVPTDGRNTAWRMVERALGRAGVEAEVRIGIEKRLPVQGGLGAGSANAAAALIGLERELGVRAGAPGWLREEERLAVAAEVGSDVPLFLVGGTVLGEGRGERVRGLGDLTLREGFSEGLGAEFGEGLGQGQGGMPGGGVACVIAVPAAGVSTPAAFREWDAARAAEGDAVARARDEGQGGSGAAGSGEVRASESGGFDAAAEAGGVGAGLRSGAVHGTLDVLSLAYALAFGLRTGVGTEKPDPSGTNGGLIPDGVFAREQTGERDGLAENSLLTLVRTGIENDFEEVVFPHHPLLRRTKRLLMGSDTGMPAIYAAMSGSGSALFGLYGSEAAARAAQQRVEASGVPTLLTRTISRERYWSEMFAELD